MTTLTKLSPGETANVKISEIRPNLVALRPPQIESEKFQTLKANIQQLGEILQPVRVRPQTDPTTQAEFYELIDGLQRFTVAQQLGWEEIPARLASADDARTLVEQIALNAVNVDTRPAEYARQLLRLLDLNPAMTKAELAQMTGMSESWVDDRLALNKLLPQIGSDFVDTGAITATNAYQLARLPQTDQLEYLEQAQSLKLDEFTASVNSRLKELRQAARAGRDPNKPQNEFEPVPSIRRASDIKTATPADIIGDQELKTPEDGVKAALNWVMQLDPESVEMQKQRWELRRRERVEAQVNRQKERAEELSKQAAERAAQLKAELGIA